MTLHVLAGTTGFLRPRWRVQVKWWAEPAT